MFMTMMQIGIVRVGMSEGCVTMRVSMRFAHGIIRTMHVGMVFVVAMAVIMFHLVVIVVMAMTLRKMQPCAKCHQ